MTAQAARSLYAPAPSADWLSAAEIAALGLPGLPRNRQDVSSRATVEGWPSRPRQGAGGGREFPATALPAEARAELIRRRIEHAVPAAVPPAAPAAVPELSQTAAGRLAAKTAMCALFDAFAGGRSVRAAGPMFCAAWNDGLIAEAAHIRTTLPGLSLRALQRALADRGAGRLGKLAATEWGGRDSLFGRSRALSGFIVALMTQRPHLDAAQCLALMSVQFDVVPCDDGQARPLPSLRSLQRWMTQWRERNRTLALQAANPDAYRSRARPAFGHADTDCTRLNQLWECDASPADVLLTDGRHSIYVMIDIWSRRMMASVTKTPRSEAVLLLLRRAILEWGVPETLRTDNGTDFVAKRIVDALQRLGIAHDLTAPFTPEQKPHVERAIGTMQHQLMELLPGYVGHNIADRQAIRARETFARRLGESADNTFAVAMTAAELQHAIDRWCVNVYAQRTHSTLGMAPAARAAQGGTVRRIEDEAALSWLLMSPPAGGDTRRVTKKGLSIAGVDYWCEGLIVGDTIHVRTDPDDLGRVWCYRGEPWTFVGVAINPERAGLSRAAFAARARATQAAYIRERRAEIRAASRTLDIDGLVEAHLANERGQTIVAFPQPSVPHVTASLAAAAEAAAAAVGAPPPLPVSTEERAQQQAFVLDFAAAASRREETGDDRYRRWREIDAAILADRPVGPEDRRWHSTYATTSEWRAQTQLFRAFGPAAPSNTG